MGWLAKVLAWHRANVLGNVVASVEMAAALVAFARPLLRHLLARARRHLAAQVDAQLGPIHRRFDELWEHLLPDGSTERPGSDPDRTDHPDQPKG